MPEIEAFTKTIEADTEVPGYPNYRVLKGGDYSDEELVEVYDIKDNSIRVAFQAHYIVRGRCLAEE